MSYIQKGEKDFKKTMFALFLGSFVTFAELYSIQSVIPLISEQFETSPAGASLSLSFSTGTMAVMLLLISFLTTGINKRFIMGIALILSSLLSISVLFTESMTQLLVLRTLQGAALAGYPAIAMAYIVEEFHPKSIGLVMGMYVSGNSLGGLAGRLIVGSLSEYISWNYAIALLGFVSLFVSIGFILMIRNSTNHAAREPINPASLLTPIMHNLKRIELVLLFIIGFVLMGSFVSVYNYIGIVLVKDPYHLSQVFVSFIFIVYLVGTFSSAWMGRLADKYPRKKVLISGLSIMLLGGIITLAAPLVVKIIGLTIFTFGFFGSHSITSSWVGLLASQKEKTYASSLYLLFYYVGSSVLGTLGGVFFHANGWVGEIMMVVIALSIGLLSAVCISVKKPLLATKNIRLQK